MSKLVKSLIAIVGLFVVVGAAGAAYVAFVFDPNDFKNTIQAQVKEQTGRDLTISGDISLSLFPWLGVELGGVSMSNAPGFGSEPFAEMKQAQVRVKLMPLLSKQIEVGRVVLDGAVLRLAKNAEGKGNWEDLQEQGSKSKDSSDKSKRSGDMEVKSLKVEGLSVNDAAVFWNDQQSKQNYQLSQFNLQTGTLSPDMPVDLTSNFNIASTEPAMTASVALAGKLTADTEQQRYRLEGTNLKVDAKGKEIPNVTALLNGLVQLDLQSELVSISEMKLNADVSGADLPDIRTEMTGAVRGNLGTSLYRLDDLILTANAKGESVPGESQQAKVNGNIAIDLANQRLQAPALIIEALGSKITADVEGYSIVDDPRFTGKLNTSEMNPRYMIERLGMEKINTTDPGVLAKATLQGQFEATADRLELSQLNARLDDTGMDGSLSVRNFAKPAIRFNLNVDQLDLDRYLPPEVAAEKQADKSAAPKKQANGDEEIPVDSIRDLDLNGVLKAGRFKAYGLQFTNATVLLSAANGTLKVEPLTSDFYNGRVKMATTVNAAGETPSYALAANIDAVQAGPFIKALTGEDKIDGLANIQINLQSIGKTIDQMKRGMDGTIDFRFADGAVKGFNLGNMLRTAQAKLSGEAAPASETEQTDFTAMTGSAKIVKGVVQNYDLNAMSPAFRVSGEGKFDLVQESMDYLANIAVVKTVKGQGGDTLDNLKGVSIPLRCKGGFDTPVTKLCVPDIAGALKAKAEARLDEEKEKARAKIEQEKAEARAKLEDKKKEQTDKLKDKFDDKLKDLFKRPGSEEPAAQEPPAAESTEGQ